MKTPLRIAAWLVALGAAGAARANWTASGQFLYVDREYDLSGFTGSEPNLPVRLADRLRDRRLQC